MAFLGSSPPRRSSTASSTSGPPTRTCTRSTRSRERSSGSTPSETPTRDVEGAHVLVLARRLRRQGLRREVVASRCPLRPRDRHGAGCRDGRRGLAVRPRSPSASVGPIRGNACTTDADCSGSSCVPFLVCRSGSGEQSAEPALRVGRRLHGTGERVSEPLGSGLTSSAAIDAGRGAVYVDFGDCIGAGNTGFSNSLVALDAETGALRWDFSPIPNGNLGDLDFISSPNLFTIPGGTTPSDRRRGREQERRLLHRRSGHRRSSSGSKRWWREARARRFSRVDGRRVRKIYAATFTGPPYIFALDATNGAVAWQCPPTECNVFSFGPPGSQAACTSWATARVSFGRSMPGRVRCSESSTSEAQIHVGPGGRERHGVRRRGDWVLSPAGESQGAYGLGLDRRAARARRTGTRMRAGTESEDHEWSGRSSMKQSVLQPVLVATCLAAIGGAASGARTSHEQCTGPAGVVH